MKYDFECIPAPLFSGKPKILLDEVLPIVLSNANDGRTKHFGASASRRKKYERLIFVREPLDEPVVIVVTRILGPRQRLMDTSSLLRGSYKELEDAMVACGWFHDDKPEWIAATIARQDAGRRQDGPATRITAYEAGAFLRVLESIL